MNNIEWGVFYDETNNYRKVFLEDGKLNISYDSNFVLAGIMTQEKADSAVWTDLYRKIGICNDISELKARNVFNGDFQKCLSSKKLNNFLHLLLEMNVYVHFLNLNILYWAIIDIIESLFCIRKAPNILQRRATSVLLEVARIDKKNFITLLSSFGYPDVKDRVGFIKSISELIKKNAKEIDRSNSICNIDICGLCCACDVYKNEKLEFIEDGAPGVILEDFLQMYLHIPMKFPQTRHFFDKEDLIQKLFEQQRSIFPDLSRKIFFIDSKSDIRIQISDVIAGFLGKYFTFISSSSKKIFKKSFRSTESNSKRHINRFV